jgi:extradiol dioxygenase
MYSSVCQLGYVGFRVSDMAGWRQLAEVLGLEVIDRGDTVHLRTDDCIYRIALHAADRDELAYVGWQAGGKDDFGRLVCQLRAAGASVAPGAPEDCRLRHVEGLAQFTDPNGFPGEVYFGARAGEAFTPSRPISGFKTGSQGLGHIVLRCADRDAGVKFYCDALGFRITDTANLTSSKMEATFLHCNARHHSLALTTSVPSTASRVSHPMIEANVMEDVGKAFDLCKARGLPIWLSLGQHTNDRMMSFYVRSPSEFAVELGYGAVEIDEASWEPNHWATASYWGHQRNDVLGAVEEQPSHMLLLEQVAAL